MRSDNLYPSLFVSFGVHILVVAAVMLVATLSRTYIMPATYVVSLVDGPSRAGSREVSPRPAEKPSPEPETKKAEQKPKPETKVAPDRDRISDRIAALKAKKKVERLVDLKRNLDVSRTTRNKAAGGPAAAGGSADYEALVISRIHDHWALPERIDKDLLAIVHIRIARNGMITIENFEQKSGSTVFDRAAIRAISDASPLPPPPREMDFAVRFHP